MIAITILGELRRVAYRPISIWPFITKVVKIWQKLPKSKQPKYKNCETTRTVVDDQLTSVKISFFRHAANFLKLYLVACQTDKPIILSFVGTFLVSLENF